MEQKELRAWEARCVQEETVRCTAACPLHVDARTFCKLMAEGRMDKAWAVLAKVMPLPGVLARLCDGPCKAACVRKDAGGAVEVDGLERYCASAAKPVAPPRPLPARNKRVAVLGGHLAGLCAAWELARRGFEVTLRCVDPGGPLRDLPEAALPKGALDGEIESLARLGVTFEACAALTPALLDAELADKDAVFADGDAFPAIFDGCGLPDPLTLGTQRAGLFASAPGEPSAVLRAAAARRAANSVDRYLQGVSMVTARELEGPCATRHFTSLEGVAPVPPACPDGCPDEAAARAEAARCLQCQCLECLKGCAYLRHFKGYPKVYARQIYNNESIVRGTRTANKMINSCMICGQCEAVCPEDFSMADLCLDARRTLVARGQMPPSAHEFALRDMAFADGGRCVLARHAPGTGSSAYVFFPGCQLAASDPDGVAAAYADLRARLGDVGLMLQCCGAPAHWAARDAMADDAAAALRARWEGLGSPRIIAACPTCMQELARTLPGAEIVSHWSVLRTLGLPDGAAGGGSLAISDPCAARRAPVLRDDVRNLLSGLSVDAAEPRFTGETTPCCGFGGLLSEANPELGLAVARDRAQSMDRDWVTYCVMCRDMMARAGGRALHLYDLLFPRVEDPAGRPAPGYSERRENRVRLRERLLREVWNEAADHEAEPFEAVQAAFTEAAAQNMETRRILASDVRKVLLQAERSGKHLLRTETGRRVASFRPAVVTYWVEYEPADDGYLVHNAWSHRMRIKGGQP
ncbi:pyridine nucleotide-disulfide oxidoreductase/dicluster-binding protein [Pseudodesulfovibrio sp.]|uniref:pyridine nucleotide-disulfide oxidoreductase/dicluster-binding protein n=1 Tax=Pseudodesulfovibrio sp. TaxID=2035812 RepID=UPI00261B628C|nr:pyridine nucleotide-disulfide oxidoreductase/dicluster-binding protein [Pseudodesulfovibrio sp.]MDD3313012.1 heterodisulfide reductase-related iron-sulfur binding cluster [Pseudodesulfovibrio sp.]